MIYSIFSGVFITLFFLLGACSFFWISGTHEERYAAQMVLLPTRHRPRGYRCAVFHPVRLFRIPNPCTAMTNHQSQILFNNVLLKLVGVHPETGNAFYINDGHGGLLGVRVYPSGKKVVVNQDYAKPARGVKYGKKDSYLDFRHAWGHEKSILASHAVYAAWVGPIKPGMTIDHINGCIQDNRFENLRQIPHSINMRDGGFLTKLRNKGINPVTIDRAFLLRYYDRMAKLKAVLSAQHYYRLSKAQLLKIVYDNEF